VKTHSVGIVGFGFIGKVHAYGYRNLPLFYDPVPLRAKITHICTSRKETAEKGAALIGAAHAATDFREITENPDIDIVHICTPNHLHKDQLLSAMAHNKHIYCDKPLVANMVEAEEIGKTLRRYKGTAQMTFQNRFFPATIRAKQLADEGFLGKVLEFRACYLHSGSADPNAPLKWKLSGAAGGGVIADLGSHVFDVIRHLLGDYESVLAATSIAYTKRPSASNPRVKVKVDAEDSAHVLVRMKSGAIGTIEATKIATGAEDELRFEIHGSKGALRFNGTAPNHLEMYDATAASGPAGGRRGWTRIETGQRYPAPASGFPGPKFNIGWLRGHMACLAEFLGCVASGRAANPGLADGIYVQSLIECCRVSAAKESWIGVGSGRSRPR
jgi:predicted dehydrogenase